MIAEQPPRDLEMVVVIPCHDEPDVCGSLQALAHCDPPRGSVEVIVVINAGKQHPAEVHAQNLASLAEAEAWKLAHDRPAMRFHLLHTPDLPPKHAGVGLARKIGMDEAVRRFAALGREGLILCFDADSRCQANYLVAIQQHFDALPKAATASIHFEHPLQGDWPEDVLEAILRYELYLRYYRLALQWAGHPHSWHCIGSSMAVRTSAYEAQGGMNRRKAGEDFYFLQKYIQLGQHSEVNTTKVIPSPRASHRVPFGTGKAVSAYLGQPKADYPVIAFTAFAWLKLFLADVPHMESWTEGKFEAFRLSMAPQLAEWLKEVGAWSMVEEAQDNTTSNNAFQKRFFRNMDALKALQYFHYCEEKGLEGQPLAEAVTELATALGISCEGCGLKEWLARLREYETSREKAV